MGRILIIKNVNFGNQSVDKVTPKPISVVDVTEKIQTTASGYQFIHSPGGGFINAIQRSSALNTVKAAVLDVTEYAGSIMRITWRTENKNTTESSIVYKRAFASSILTPITEIEIESGSRLNNYANIVEYINGTKQSGDDYSYITQTLLIPSEAKYLVFNENKDFTIKIEIEI